MHVWHVLISKITRLEMEQDVPTGHGASSFLYRLPVEIRNSGMVNRQTVGRPEHL
jgi:hypothetical protein